VNRSSPKKPLTERVLDAETRGNQWLADANEAKERGDRKRAEHCWEKGQFWLDRANRLLGYTDKPAPKH
jgi:hypothetical protein